MKLAISITMAIATIFSATGAQACCFQGCYAVKGSAFSEANCPDDKFIQSSIADYGGPNGDCIDISKAASISAINTGCTSSHPTFKFFKEPNCQGGYYPLDKNGGGECFEKPEGAVSMYVISN